MLLFEKNKMHTNLKPSDVFKRLQNITTGPRPFFLDGWSANETSRYCGTLTKTSFTIWHLPHLFRLAWPPVIEGGIKPTKEGTEIEIKMHVHIVILMGMLACLVFAGWIIVDTILSSIMPQASAKPSEGTLWLSLGLIVFILAVIGVPFKIEAQKEKEYLLRLFQAREKGRRD